MGHYNILHVDLIRTMDYFRKVDQNILYSGLFINRKHMGLVENASLDSAGVSRCRKLNNIKLDLHASNKEQQASMALPITSGLSFSLLMLQQNITTFLNFALSQLHFCQERNRRIIRFHCS